MTICTLLTNYLSCDCSRGLVIDQQQALADGEFGGRGLSLLRSSPVGLGGKWCLGQPCLGQGLGSVGSSQGILCCSSEELLQLKPPQSALNKVLIIKDVGSGACRLCSLTRGDVLGARDRYGHDLPQESSSHVTICIYVYIYIHAPRLGCNPANHG